MTPSPIRCVILVLAGTFCAVAGAENGSTTTPRTIHDVAEAPWPCFRGPYANGTAPESGMYE